MMDELLAAQGCGDVCLNHPVNGDRVQRSFLNPWSNPYVKEKEETCPIRKKSSCVCVISVLWAVISRVAVTVFTGLSREILFAHWNTRVCRSNAEEFRVRDQNALKVQRKCTLDPNQWRSSYSPLSKWWTGFSHDTVRFLFLTLSCVHLLKWV